MYFMKCLIDFIARVGLDKWAHLGIGGLLCALLSCVLILQEGVMEWRSLLYCAPGLLGVFVISVFKEYFVDERPDWADVWFAMAGCGLWVCAAAAGIGLYVVSH